eukprot:EG_transcript_41433
MALRTNSVVQKVNVWRNDIGPEGAKALAEALRTNATLREVNLSCNGIGDKGTVALAMALRTNSVVQKVNVWDNHIGPEGAKALAEALPPAAPTLPLPPGQGEEGGTKNTKTNCGPRQPQFMALRMNATLREVDLGCNRIGDEGTVALAMA